jgi:ADP-ribose pyrophosphatase YjhB (NUDIX family)
MIPLVPLLDGYLERYPAEEERLSRLRTLLGRSSGQPNDLIARTNFVGHVTASGFVVNQARAAVLLVYHKTLQMHVQPGGHLEASDASPLEGARREIAEETGIAALRYLPAHPDPALPFDIDSHYIPPNARKGEPEHWHHDFRYLFVCEEDTPPVANAAEVANARWVPLAQLGEFPTLDVVAEKIGAFVQR